MFNARKIKVSVCIPVCGTEEFLPECLESVALQAFGGLEVIVVDDNGFSKREGSSVSAKKILKDFCRKHKKEKIAAKFIRHEKNKGLVEARRSALYESEGDFVMFLDSDDLLLPGAVKALYENAIKTGADIVQGRALVSRRGSASSQVSSEAQKKLDKFFPGELAGRQIFSGFLVESNHSGFLWGKIFARGLCIKAFEKIPPVYCCMGEDFLTYFLISFFAEKYAGIESFVYNYFVNTGMSSGRKISSMEEWKKICSAASVFTVLLNEVQDGGILLSEQETEKLNEICRSYAANNLYQLEKSVQPELKSAAYNELCDWWGKNMIENIKKLMENVDA